MSSCYETHLFVERPPHDTLCVRCSKVAGNAVRSKACDHIYGMSCILEHLVRYESCPKCGVPLDCTMLEPSEVIRKWASDAQVHCPLGINHCEWSGKMCEMAVHVNSENCGVPKTQCPFCRFSFDSELFDAHKSECPEAFVLCPNCNDAVERRSLAEHRENCLPPEPKKKEPAAASTSRVGGARRGGAVGSSVANRRQPSGGGGSSSSSTARRSSSSTGAAAGGGSSSQKTSLSKSGERRRSQSALLTNNNNNTSLSVSELSASQGSTGGGRPATANKMNTSLVMTNQQHQQQFPPHLSPSALSLSSPSRRLLDESAMGRDLMMPSSIQIPAGAQFPGHSNIPHHQHQNNFENSFGNNKNRSSLQLSQHNHNNSYSSSNNSPPTHTVIIPPDFGSIASLCQEMSKLGQKCSDLENEVVTLRKKDEEKSEVIESMSKQLNKLTETVQALVAAGSPVGSGGGTAFSASGSGKNDSKNSTRTARPTSPIEQQRKNRASGGPSASSSSSPAASTTTTALPPVRGASKQQQAAQKGGEEKEPNYSTRNKNYKVPSDVQKQIKREAGANSIDELMKKETSLRKKMEENKSKLM